MPNTTRYQWKHEDFRYYRSSNWLIFFGFFDSACVLELSAGNKQSCDGVCEHDAAGAGNGSGNVHICFKGGFVSL